MDLPGSYQDTMRLEQRQADLALETGQPVSSMNPEQYKTVFETWFWHVVRAYDRVLNCQPWNPTRRTNELYNYGLQAAAASLHLKGADQFFKISTSMEWALLNCNEATDVNNQPTPGPSTHQANSKAKSSRFRRKDDELENIRQLVRQMRAERASHREICERLNNSPRPPHAAWRNLPWPQAYRKHTSSVAKWISDCCK
jgi:uncharacterized protein with von Willebrand factor type A (vWA) domain